MEPAVTSYFEPCAEQIEETRRRARAGTHLTAIRSEGVASDRFGLRQVIIVGCRSRILDS